MEYAAKSGMTNSQPQDVSEGSLALALRHLERAVLELGEVDSLLARSGVPEDDRSSIAACVLSLYGTESWLRELQRLRLLREEAGGVAEGDVPQRLTAGGEAHLEVVECQRIAVSNEVRGQVLELSTDGFAFSTTAPLREGDRLRFHRRWLAEKVDGDVRVASVRDADRPGSLIVSCWFVDIDPSSRAAIGRVLARATAKRNPVDYQGLLSLAEPSNRGRRGLSPFRRRA
jgi:hypothetical protein